MSTDVDIYQGQQLTYAPAVDPTGGRLVAWAASLIAAKQIANALCGTTFAPAHFRGKPDDGAAAIMFGDEVGFSPTQALRSVYVISGTPALYARQMAALIMHHGHEVWTVEKSDAKVVVSGKRRGSDHTMTETWTTARAQKAGYTKNPKYTSDPQAMLYARALADVCRQIAPDALAGLAYTVEELEITEPAATVRVSRAKALPAPMPEPDLEPETATDEPIPADDTPAPETAMSASGAGGINDSQRVRLHILVKQLGISREQKIAGLVAIIKRPVESSNDLTEIEAAGVIASLTKKVNALPAPDDAA